MTEYESRESRLSDIRRHRGLVHQRIAMAECCLREIRADESRPTLDYGAAVAELEKGLSLAQDILRLLDEQEATLSHPDPPTT